MLNLISPRYCQVWARQQIMILGLQTSHRLAPTMVSLRNEPIPCCEIDLLTVRSPCPGLNTLANHGFIHHDGRNMTIPHLLTGLAQGMVCTTISRTVL